MSRQRTVSAFGNLDVMTFWLYLSLIGVGWLMIFTVGYDDEMSFTDMVFNLNTNIGKQTLWIGVSFLLLIFVLFIDWNFWRTFGYIIYAVSMAGLVAVLLFGVKIKGATSWFSIFGFTLQPAEFAKFATNIALASFLSTYNTKLSNIRSQLTAFGIILIPIVLVLLQPDAGSGLIFLSFLIVFFREGASLSLYIFGVFTITVFILGLVYNPLFIILGLVLLSIFIFLVYQKNKLYWMGGLALLVAGSILATQLGYLYPVLGINGALLLGAAFLQYQERRQHLLKPVFAMLIFGGIFSFTANYTFTNFLKNHQRDRINVWLRPSLCDPQGSLYNVLQSKSSIGSGGLSGKGFLQGTMTKLNYVPEQSTDFIFCTVGEEQGFIGTVGIVGLFFLLLYRITILAERQRSDFSRIYAYGVAGILFFHFFINIGMTMGLVPIIGIPLPFISYGGSSILGFTLLIGVLLSLDRNRLTG